MEAARSRLDRPRAMGREVQKRRRESKGERLSMRVDEKMNGTRQVERCFIEGAVGVAEQLRRAGGEGRKRGGTGSSSFRRRRHMKVFYLTNFTLIVNYL